MLAKVLVELGRLREGIEAHYEAVRLWPTNFDLWNDLARLHHQAGTLPKAANALKMALKIQPEYVTGWQVLAEMYEDMGMLEEKRYTEATLQKLLRENTNMYSDDISKDV